jgi:hypothetical protein
MKITLIFVAVINLLSLSLILSVKMNKKKRSLHSNYKMNKKNEKTFSFLETHREDKNDYNAMFNDEYAVDDSYDNTNEQQKPMQDYNSDVESKVDELLNKVKDDLTGEDVNYRFD